MEYIDSTCFTSKPQIDIRATELVGLCDTRQELVGRHLKLNEAEWIVDSASDIGDGWWRLRLTPPPVD